MRGILGAFEGWFPFNPPGSLVHLLTTGDSMSVGTGAGVTSGTKTSAFGCKMLFDSSSTYDITNPNAGTLSLATQVCPARSTASGEYPTNISGYSINFFICEELAAMALAAGYISYPLSSSCCGSFAHDLTSISAGTVSYNASIYEVTAQKRLNGGSLFCRAVVCNNGGIDAVEYVPSATYAINFALFASGYDTDIRAVTGQSAHVFMCASQQIALPNTGFGPNLIAPAQIAIALASGGAIICPNARYPYPTFTGDHGHLSDYSGEGAKQARAIFEHSQWLDFGIGSPWLPLYASGVARVGTQVTVTYVVRHLPLVWASINDNDDHSVSPPHQPGIGYSPITPWSSGNGFEAWDSPMTPNSATNATPIQVGFGTTLPAQVTTGSMMFIDGIAGNTNANGAFWVRVDDPSHVSLFADAARTTPIAGNGTATFGSPQTRAFAVIGITSAVISGSTVVLTLARLPGTGLHIGYADTADGWGYNVDTGGFPSGRCGILRDSDPQIDLQGRPQYNWALEFSQAVP